MVLIWRYKKNYLCSYIAGLFSHFTAIHYTSKSVTWMQHGLLVKACKDTGTVDTGTVDTGTVDTGTVDTGTDVKPEQTQQCYTM